MCLKILADCGLYITAVHDMWWPHLLSLIIFSLPTCGCTSVLSFVKSFFLLLQGGFARVHELIDLTTNTVYAGKIIPKNRITKRHHMQKVRK